MAWGKAGSKTGSGSSIDITDLTSNKFNQVMSHNFLDGVVDFRMRLGNGSFDSGTSYSDRLSNNGGADVTSLVNQSDIHIINTASGYDSMFVVMYMINIATKEKLDIFNAVATPATGAGSAPERMEGVNKWTNTSDQFDYIQIMDESGSNIDTDSNLTVLGSDMTPASAVTFPTDVQVGSRAEITDSRKMYYSTPTSVDTEDVYDEITGRTDVSSFIARESPNYSNGEGRYLGLEINDNAGGQALVGKGVKKIKVRLYRGTALTGTYRVGIMDSSGTVKGFSDHNASEVTGSSATYSHTMNNAVILAVGDIIFISYTATTNPLYLRTNNITTGFGSNYNGAFSPRSVTTGTTWVTSLDGDASRLWMFDFDFAPATDQSVPLTWKELGT